MLERLLGCSSISSPGVHSFFLSFSTSSPKGFFKNSSRDSYKTFSRYSFSISFGDSSKNVSIRLIKLNFLRKFLKKKIQWFCQEILQSFLSKIVRIFLSIFRNSVILQKILQRFHHGVFQEFYQSVFQKLFQGLLQELLQRFHHSGSCDSSTNYYYYEDFPRNSCTLIPGIWIFYEPF